MILNDCTIFIIEKLLKWFVVNYTCQLHLLVGKLIPTYVRNEIKKKEMF